IIDYIFRELAITYLGRHDLAHVAPDDLRGDALHDETAETVFEEEPTVAPPAGASPSPPAALPQGGEGSRAEKADPFSTPRSGHLKPLNGDTGNGHRDGNGHAAAKPNSPPTAVANPRLSAEENI